MQSGNFICSDVIPIIALFRKRGSIMIESMTVRGDRLVEIRLSDRERERLISCEASCAIEGDHWRPAAIYPDLSGDFALDGSYSVWNQAVTMGIVRLTADTEAIYWNCYLDIGTYTGNARLRLVFMTEDGEYEEERSVNLEQTGVVYLNDWSRYLGSDGAERPLEGDGKWKIGKGRIGPYVGMAFHERLPPIRIPVQVEGWYDIYFGTAGGWLRFMARAGDAPFNRVMTPHLTAGYHAGKVDQELLWTRCYLRNDWIEIAQLQETAVSHYDFGRISYIKLVPVDSPVPTEAGSELSTGLQAETGAGADAAASRSRELILYYEPYSYSLHGFHDGASMNGVMLEEFLRLRPTEISCQTIRIGMKSLHHSRHVERLNEAAVTDFKTTIDDPVKLVANCDILRETVSYIRGRNVRLTANIGMNRPYLWNKPLSEAFVRQNPHLVKDGDLDYGDPEVRRYALLIIEEIVQDYDVDGLVFDYMRHFKNQTVESLVETISATKAFMRRKERLTGAKLELKVRVPADQAVYYRALKICAAQGDVDGIIPSNLLTSEPLPPIGHYMRLKRDTGVKVYGCIDGWKRYLASDPRAGAMLQPHSPSDIVRYMATYDELGVDGIFMYQADELTGNPYLNKLI
jgi:hypothetical protein